MLLHYHNEKDNIFFRVETKEECKTLFEQFCSVRSTLRQRVTLEECKVESLSEDLGFMIQSILGNKKHFYRYDGRGVLLYLSKGYKPKPLEKLI